MDPRSRLERLLRPLSDVRAGEGVRAVAMLANLLLLMIAYYLLKTVREPLILGTAGAEVKSYAAGLQALLLMGFVPAYVWLTRRVGRRGLIVGLVGFFFVNLELFYLGLRLGWHSVGVAFFVWVGIFSLSVISQFWSLANDLYSQEQGERLFPVVAFGATLGSPIGARIAETLFKRGVAPATMMQIAAALLLVHGAISLRLARNPKAQTLADRPLANGAGGFRLVARSSYLRFVALLLVLLNVVNTVGEYVLGKNVVHAAELAVKSGQAASKAEFIGGFYGNFFFWVNVAAALLQALAVSRLVKRFGVRGVLLFLPTLALGAYGAIATGVSFAITRWLKTAENATDYSIMNTGRALLWLPTSRQEKYRAKQTIDTFFVRLGDVIATALVAGVAFLKLAPTTLAAANALLAVAWVLVAARVARKNGELSQRREPATGAESSQPTHRRAS
jgi:AAA family ATP:ADP antiporter